MKRGYSPRNLSDDQLAVLCWCETHVLHVDRTVILAGKTESCGAKNCRDNTTVAA